MPENDPQANLNRGDDRADAPSTWGETPAGLIPARVSPSRRLRPDPQWIVRRPVAAWNLLTLTGLALVLSAVLLWAQGQPRIAPGQVLGQTVLVRVPMEIVDRAGTESARQQARAHAPRVYVGDAAAFDVLRSSLENLPKALADVARVEDIDPTIRRQFAFTPETLAALKRQATGGQVTPWWAQRVQALDRLFRVTPVLDPETYQREIVAANDRVELILGDKTLAMISVGEVQNIDSPQLDARLRTLGAVAGFSGELLDLVSERLRAGLKPTYTFDPQISALRQQAAAQATPTKTNTFTPGQVIAARGDVLANDKLDLIKAEAAAFRDAATAALAGEQLALIGTAILAALGLGAFTATYAPSIWRSPPRLAALAGMMVAATALAVWTAVASPWLTVAAITTPALFLTIVLAVAYDRPTALALGSLLGIVVCVALDQPVASIGLALSGVWVSVWRIREFRQRNMLIQAGAFTGLALSLTVVLLAGVQRPLTGPAATQALWEVLTVAVAALLCSFVVLGTLPWIERLFNVTTGMTLIELRDPQHPLLKLLQQRAAGTYNHALNVAAISESAAQAINADSLLTYVGALYHDVGKMSKPEFFVENQAGGLNKHDKLSPATSLLVIVGHVQEGLQLARQFALPRCVHHFIESHHGTTLVEYFFHRARKQAEPGGPLAAGPIPQEIEYRYPGPKPRTREAAILMIADAAESATRTLPDPTATRIESLVRAIAHKRLMDGQFDNCDLTLRDVHTIVESLTRSLAAIHHQRIAYPAGPSPVGPRSAPAAPPAPSPQAASPVTVGPVGRPQPAAGAASPVTAAAPAGPRVGA
jgi:putative nucleotidyltransferase with HDIG domain